MHAAQPAEAHDHLPGYLRKCGVCDGQEEVLAVTEWNRGLCRRCLPKALENRVLGEMRRRQMVATGERIGVAVSGGKDSAALLAVLATLRERKPFQLVALHLDMGIGDYSAACRAAVEALCRRYAVPLLVERVADYGVRAEGVGPWPVCAVCGGVRRALLPRLARRANLAALATGHTMEDMLQVMLKQLMAGRSFAPKPVLPATPYDPRKLKPLYFVPEKVTAAYAEARGLEYVAAPCPYFVPSSHRFKAVFEQLERMAPMAKMQVLTNLGRLLRPPPVAERSFVCEDCGERARRPLCPLCMIRRLQNGQPVPFLKSSAPPLGETGVELSERRD
jgi:uncharacterized protein (TIGR00269 family)